MKAKTKITMEEANALISKALKNQSEFGLTDEGQEDFARKIARNNDPKYTKGVLDTLVAIFC